MISILYVDSWPPLMDIICQFLERKGDVVVDTSISDDEALKKMEYIFFDAIVTDYNFAEPASIDLLQRARESGIITPFVFFTLEVNSRIEQEASRFGRVAFVPKLPKSGFTFETLERTIRTIISEPNLGNIYRQKGTVTRCDAYHGPGS